MQPQGQGMQPQGVRPPGMQQPVQPQGMRPSGTQPQWQQLQPQPQWHPQPQPQWQPHWKELERERQMRQEWERERQRHENEQQDRERQQQARAEAMVLEQLRAAREAKQLQMQQLSTGAPPELRCCKCNLPSAAMNELRVCCAAECSRAYHPRCLRSPPAPGSDPTWLCPRCAPRQSAAERRAKFLKWSGAASVPNEPSPPTLQALEDEETPAAAAVAAAMAAASNKWAAAKAKCIKGRRPLPPPATEASEEEEEEADEQEQQEQQEQQQEQGRGQDLCFMTASDAMFDVPPPSVRRGAPAARGKKRARPGSTLHVGMRVDARWGGLKTW